jgi:hypothetical protein
MLKQISAVAHFLEPIHHREKLNIFTGVRGQLLIEAVLFDSESCEHDIKEEPDGSLTMHDVTFPDGSTCYFETDPNGIMTHFMSTAYLEWRDGMLVVSQRSFYDAEHAKLEQLMTSRVPSKKSKAA